MGYLLIFNRLRKCHSGFLEAYSASALLYFRSADFVLHFVADKCLSPTVLTGIFDAFCPVKMRQSLIKNEAT
jgi:hypothetical protein